MTRSNIKTAKEPNVKHAMVIALVTSLSFLSVAPDADAGRRVVVRKSPRGTRVRVTTHRGFPIHRALPQVVVRRPVVRVAPRSEERRVGKECRSRVVRVH